MTATTQRNPGLVREHFTRAGKPKRKFTTRAEAAGFRAHHDGVKSKRIYRCTICGAFHLGGRR